MPQKRRLYDIYKNGLNDNWSGKECNFSKAEKKKTVLNDSTHLRDLCKIGNTVIE